MRKYYKYLLFVLMFMPFIVFAEDELPLSLVAVMQLFATIHMTLFFHLPFSTIITQDDVDKKRKNSILKKMIIGRFVILIFGDLIFGYPMLIIDFSLIFIGAFGIVPITAAIMSARRKKILASIPTSESEAIQSTTSVDSTSNIQESNNLTETKATNMMEKTVNYKECPSCKALNSSDNLFCTSCGTSIENVTPKPASNPGYCPNCRAKLNPGVLYCVNCGLELSSGVLPSGAPARSLPALQNANTGINADPQLRMGEKELLSSIIDEELKNNHYDGKMMIPGLRNRRLVFTLIFAIVTFLCVCLIFFHLPIAYYLVYFIFLFIYVYNMKNYNINRYLMKQIKSRPDEKIANIVSSVVASARPEKNTSFEYIAMFLVAFLLPCVIFSKTRIFYEKMDDGYGVRFYAFGLTEFKTATIPDTYNGEDIVSIRGNGFSNMFFLESVTLPDTITEIRGQAFKNDYNLREVNMPKNLKYLGGGSFYNCSSITKVEFPETLTFIGGETFKNATSLREVNIPDGIEEIRGDTFENCTSLEKIDIPDSVTRIGGHAFYGDDNLSEVNFTKNSQLKEIGSSAFRLCSSLRSITLPKGVSINERAFKESPTKIHYFVDIPGIDDSYYQNRSSFYSVGSSDYLYDDTYHILYTVRLEEKNESTLGTTYTFTLTDSNDNTKRFTVSKGSSVQNVYRNVYVEYDSEGYSSISLNFYYK